MRRYYVRVTESRDQVVYANGENENEAISKAQAYVREFGLDRSMLTEYKVEHSKEIKETG